MNMIRIVTDLNVEIIMFNNPIYPPKLPFLPRWITENIRANGVSDGIVSQIYVEH